MYPNEYFSKTLKKISKQMRVTFLSCFIVGILTHFYMLTNKLPNYDDVNCLTTYGTGVISGRFMLAVLGKGVRVLLGNYSMPWLHGLVGIFFISLASSIVVNLLNIKYLINCFFTGIFMIVSPAITGTFFFMFTIPYYSFSIFLTVLSVWVSVRYSKGIIAAPILLALSMGIYQAYFPLAAGLFLLILYQRLITADKYKQILISSFKYILVLILALILYFILNKAAVTLLGQGITSYQGLDDMGKISIKELPDLIVTAYKNYLFLMIKDISGMNPYIVTRASILILHLIIITNVVSTIKALIKQQNNKQTVWLIAGNIICIVLFPLAIDCIYIMANNSNVYSLMLYPTVLPLLLAVLIMDHIQADGVEGSLAGLSVKIRKFFCWLGTFLMLTISGTQIYYANVQYLAIQMQYEQAYSYFVTMITQIKMTEGYSQNLPLVIIGDNIFDSSFYENNYFEERLSGRTQTLINIFSRNEFLKIYLGFNQPIEKKVQLWADLPEVQSMPCYPDTNAIRKVNGAIVLKLGN